MGQLLMGRRELTQYCFDKREKADGNLLDKEIADGNLSIQLLKCSI